MQHTGFGKKYRLAEKRAELWQEELYSAPDFLSVTDKFLNDNFRGLFTLDKSVSAYRYIKLTAEYIIKFFKAIIYNIHGEELLFVNISCDIEDFRIEARLKPGLEFNVFLRRELSRLARSAGFDAYLSENGLLIKKKTYTPSAIPIYARPIESNILEGKFYEIFFGNK